MYGKQRQWNRQCELTAWSTYIIACSFGAFENQSFVDFLDKFPPPGYAPETKPERPSRRKRPKV